MKLIAILLCFTCITLAQNPNPQRVLAYLRRALSFMRTLAVKTFGHVAVVAKHLKTLGVVVSSQPRVETVGTSGPSIFSSADRLPLIQPLSIDVVNRQKLDISLAATSAEGHEGTAVSDENRISQLNSKLGLVSIEAVSALPMGMLVLRKKLSCCWQLLVTVCALMTRAKPRLRYTWLGLCVHAVHPFVNARTRLGWMFIASHPGRLYFNTSILTTLLVILPFSGSSAATQHQNGKATDTIAGSQKSVPVPGKDTANCGLAER